MKIQANIGAIDRAGRIIAGIVLLLLVPLAFVGPGTGWALLGLLGLFPLVAGIVGYCPPYALLGINTCKDGTGRRAAVEAGHDLP
jgi:hypothetical protein